MEDDISDTYFKIKEISKKYPDIKFKFCEARDALRKSLKLKKINIKFKTKIKKIYFTLDLIKKFMDHNHFYQLRLKIINIFMIILIYKNHFTNGRIPLMKTL